MPSKDLPGQMELVPPEPEKWCNQGKHFLPISGFARAAKAKDGRQHVCRECRKIYNANNYSRGKTCADCGRPVVNHSKGRCMACSAIARRGTGGKDRARAVNAYGYVILNGYWDHPNHNKRGQVLEHVLVMSRVLGRPLVKGELWSKVQPCGQRIPDKVAWAKEILALYEPSALAASERDAA